MTTVHIYRKYDDSATGSKKFEQKFCLKNLVKEYRLGLGVGD